MIFFRETGSPLTQTQWTIANMVSTSSLIILMHSEIKERVEADLQKCGAKGCMATTHELGSQMMQCTRFVISIVGLVFL